VIPVALSGTREFLRDGTYFPRPSRITITLSPPLRATPPQANSRSIDSSRAPDSDWHEVVHLRDTTRQQIAANSGEPLL
jgi:hypothetical protein